MLEALHLPAVGLISMALAAAIPWLLTARWRTRVLVLAFVFVAVVGVSFAHAEWEERRSACIYTNGGGDRHLATRTTTLPSCFRTPATTIVNSGAAVRTGGSRYGVGSGAPSASHRAMTIATAHDAPAWAVDHYKQQRRTHCFYKKSGGTNRVAVCSNVRDSFMRSSHLNRVG